MYVYKETQIDSAIVVLVKDAGKLQDKIHALGVASLVACMRSKATMTQTVERINAIQNASSYHSKPFSVWVSLFTPFTWNNETKEWVGHAKKKVTKAMCTEGKAKPFWECKPAPKVTEFNDIDELFKLIDKISKKAKKGGDNVTVHPAIINALDKVAKQAEILLTTEKAITEANETKAA